MDVFAIGSQVRVSDVVSARVTAIFIREHRVSYEIVWWAAGARACEVVEPWEIQTDNENANALRINPIL